MNTPKLAGSRLRNALLASALTLGVVGSGAVITNTHPAFAEAVKVEAPAPADFSAIVEQVKPAVVSVRVKGESRPVAFNGRSPEEMPEEFREFFRRFGGEGPEGFNRGPFGGPFGERGPQGRQPRFSQGQGSGFFISEDGYLVTNNHVVDGASEVTVALDDGRELNARVVGTDPRTDLALIKVEGNGFKYVTFANEAPKIGQWVLAVGNPFGLGGTVTAGIVSANGRDIGSGPYDDFLQIDAPVNRGNSGGPTFNVRGEVVGVNTAIFSPSGGNVGIAFAVPVHIVRDVVTDLQANGKVTRGWLGVQIQPVTQDIADSLGLAATKGALVNEPQSGGPAAAAGIRAGDVIVEVDGKSVEGPRELARMIAAYEPDQDVQVKLIRDGAEQTIAVKLGTLSDQVAANNDPRGGSDTPDAQPQAPAGGALPELGLTLAPNDRGQGVVVTEVASDSPAEEKGLQPGDVITAVGGAEVRAVADVEAGIKAAGERGRKAVLVQVTGERGNRFVALPLASS